MTINHSLSSPITKYGETIFVKKFGMGNELFWPNRWKMFHMVSIDQIMQGGEKVTLQIGN